MEPYSLVEADDDIALRAVKFIRLLHPASRTKPVFEKEVQVYAGLACLHRELLGDIKHLSGANMDSDNKASHSNNPSEFVHNKIYHARTRILVFISKITESTDEHVGAFVDALHQSGFFYALLDYINNPTMCNIQAASKLKKCLNKIQCTAPLKK